MSNTTVLLDDLSFGGIKDSLKTFLQEQSNFSDYDFEGSNFAVLLDVLAYNTQQNGYMLNMIFNEGFIDTAENYDSIVSHAKELNYTPRSVTSASLVCNVTITPSTNTVYPYITIPANTTFSASASNAGFTFRTIDTYTATLANAILNSYNVGNVIAYEGTVFTDVYTINWADTTQEFTIQNANADTSSLKVTVQNGTTNTIYTKATSMLDYDGNSTIFFVEATYNQKFKVIFGDGLVGKTPENGATLYISQRVPKGAPANGVSAVSSGSINGHANVVATVTSNSAGGAARETLESIKYYAPRYFQTRERAVTASDYETLLSTNFPEISAIHVYGGEEMDPPQFGKVAISIDLSDADGISTGRETLYYTFLRARCPITVEPIFVDPDFLEIKVVSTVNFDASSGTITATQLAADVLATIDQYNTDNLEDFNVTLYLSKLMTAINDTDTAIRSNQTYLYMRRTLELADSASIYNTKFHNAIEPDSLTSTSVVYQSDTCYFGDDGEGNVTLFTYVGTTPTILDARAGTINYTTGDIAINSIALTNAADLFTLTATPQNQDILVRENTILQIDMDNVTVATTTS